MRRLLAAVVVAHLAMAVAPAHAVSVTTASWESWLTVPGIFDVDGPRSDGSMVIAGSAALYLVDPAGTVTPFARGPNGYHEDAGAEAYLAVSPGGHVSSAGCDFLRDETYVLRLHAPVGLNRVSVSGDVSGSFTNLTGVTSLNGIVFDTTGAFDHRLLVSGQSGSNTVIFAVDCTGAAQVITRTAPALEGGLAVAPSSFGSFGGSLIAPDELSGNVYAITATGVVSAVAKPELPTGGDIGVEGAGFVPVGLINRGGAVYYADRVTPNNPHPGTDRLLRLPAAQLAAAGVQDGDLLLATEGGASMVAVHCAVECTVLMVVPTATQAHGEGHLAFTVQPPTRSPIAATPSRTLGASSGLAVPTAVLFLLLALLAGAGVLVRRRRQR
jgi:hypothetical protein